MEDFNKRDIPPKMELTVDYQMSILMYLTQYPSNILKDIDDSFFDLVEFKLGIQVLKKYYHLYKDLPSEINMKQFLEEQIRETPDLSDAIKKDLREVIEDMYVPLPAGDINKIKNTLIDNVLDRCIENAFMDFAAGKISNKKLLIRMNKLSTLGENGLNEKFLISKTMADLMNDASKEPIPKMIFSELWHETELCILFSYTGSGKSVLAFQIANAVSKGEEIAGFKMEAEKQRVLYFNFELSGKQLQKRYSNNFENNYKFDENFIHVQLDANEAKILPGEKYEDYLIEQIEHQIVKADCKIVFFDNLTYLKGDVERAKDALPFMKKLNELKKRYGLSLLVLAHTPKRNASLPISLNDLAGSSMLFNFCDSCFTIGESTDNKKIKYIKQLKQRYTENIYGANNVIICQLEQPDNFLQFTHMGYGEENNYLKSSSNVDQKVLEENVIRSHKEGLSYRKISRELGISHSKVQRIVKRKLVSEVTLSDD